MDTSVIAFVIDKKELQEQEDDCIICMSNLYQKLTVKKRYRSQTILNF